MSISIMTNPYGTEVKKDGAVIRRSKNLRGMRDYARVSPVASVTAQPSPANQFNGLLEVLYADGATCSAHFADYRVMLTFVANRKSWRAAKITIVPQTEGVTS